MDSKDNNAEKDSGEKTAAETATETMKCKLAGNWKVIAGILVVVIILLNTFWNMTESKINETLEREIGPLKSDLAAFSARLSEAEKAVDFDAINADISAIRQAGENFEKKLLAVIKAEELKLTELENNAANQKAYIDELKGLLEGVGE